MEFNIGEKVVYPNQGVCEIEEVGRRSIAGRQERFLVLRILSNSSTVMIPLSNLENVGLRSLSTEEELHKLFEILESDSNEPDPDWKNRYKDNVEKMKTGCLLLVGEVLQNLHFLSYQKPLSFREKKMYDRARLLVISEIATIRSTQEDEVEEHLDSVLSDAYERSQMATSAV